MKPSNLYYYKAYVTRVPNGVSCLVDIDLGLNIWTRGQEIELHNIEPIHNTKDDPQEAKSARDFLSSLILDREILLHTVKDRRAKHGRFFGEIAVVTRGLILAIIVPTGSAILVTNWNPNEMESYILSILNDLL